ncbi:hypothetical protein E4J89_15800 [Arthrobacter sp. CAU 1506]|uniref:hypothetical protein n=1 Tax=Arthrobacter sp. CAU 1506 TaxID=2560052 RepID=UPI0010AC7A6F|nr:hypothetical protein [Arthrobacter sp. CAU 1506]TJY67343.1 hypothetical protein E4J89_15800 [Arthrobacter sp. CAU 1506]
MLAQFLPGFRDFRTPLVTGYLWLAVVWIVTGMQIPDKTKTTGIMGLINWLSGYTSSAAVLAVLSFVAYVVGILLTIDANRATVFMARFGRKLELTGPEEPVQKYKIVPYFGTRDRDVTVASRNPLLSKLLDAALDRAEEQQAAHFNIRRRLKLPFMDEDDFRARHDESRQYQSEADFMAELRQEALEEARPVLLKMLEEEVPKLATKLQKDNKDLFDSYDRDRSEVEFRLSIAFPIAVLSVQLFLLGSASDQAFAIIALVAGLVASLVLLRKGWRKVIDSTDVVMTALEIGAISSHTIKEIDALEPHKKSSAAPPQKVV